MSPMLPKVDPGYQMKSMVSKRGTKGAVVVAVVVSDVGAWVSLYAIITYSTKRMLLG